MMTDHNEGQRDWGCLTVLLLTIPMIDAFGAMLSNAGELALVVLALGLGGSACGVAIGCYLSAKVERSWWSSWRWAIYGLMGLCLPAFVFVVLARWL
jgi:F0F1-type ATP synthase membrane subunit a